MRYVSKKKSWNGFEVAPKGHLILERRKEKNRNFYSTLQCQWFQWWLTYVFKYFSNYCSYQITVHSMFFFSFWKSKALCFRTWFEWTNGGFCFFYQFSHFFNSFQKKLPVRVFILLHRPCNAIGYISFCQHLCWSIWPHNVFSFRILSSIVKMRFMFHDFVNKYALSSIEFCLTIRV